MSKRPTEIERTLARHAREHEALARLSQIALREHQLRTLMDEIVSTVSETLDLELCGICRLREDEDSLDIVTSVGPDDAPTVLPGGTHTQAGYAILIGESVVSEDLATETRFDASHLLGIGMRSSVTAIVEGHQRPYGVLSAHTSRPRRFSADDVNFLVAIANVLSAAVERTRREEIARHAALHDPLTGLPNRTLSLDRLDLALARRRRDGTTVALLLIDIDRFTMINESLGHEVGDEVIVALARRLREAVRGSDTAARMGADEFAVVCECDGGVRGVVDLAQQLAAILREPVTIAGDQRSFTASIGIAVAEGSDATAASMLRDADAATYRAKRRGSGSYELFDARMRSQLLSRMRIESELREAIASGQLCVHYQPIIDTLSGRPLATEALVRWMHPRHGLVPPLDFIPVAEETGLIADVGRFVLQQACEQTAAWQRRFETPLEVFVNVSGLQMKDPAFVDEVTAIARSSRMIAGTLGLEVTESVLIEARSSATSVLRQLHDVGVRLMLDDFGTGYSSLSYLRNLPLDGLKVDRSFVDGLTHHSGEGAIVRAIIDMCRALGLATVAEGVESEAQLLQLRELECGLVQGYLLCRPQAAPNVGEFLERHLLAAVDERDRSEPAPVRGRLRLRRRAGAQA